MTNVFSVLAVGQFDGREIYDEVREAVEESEAPPEEVDGFDGEAFKQVTEGEVTYAVFDGATTWLVTAMVLTASEDELDALVRTKTEQLIERRG